MLFIGIDPGTATGWAVVDREGDRVDSGVWRFNLTPEQRPGRRFVQFASALSGLLREWMTHDDLSIGYEQSYPATTVSAEMYGGWVACIALVCEQLQLPYAPIHYATAKAYALSGRATKAQMVEAAAKQFDLPRLEVVYHDGLDGKGEPRLPTFPRNSADEADALWIAATLQARPETTIRRPQAGRKRGGNTHATTRPRATRS